MTAAASEPRVALISGAGSRTGIGFATARILGKSGLDLIITGASDRVFQRAQELRDEGFSATAFQADLTDDLEVGGLVESVKLQSGR